ncbi:MAG TPA: FecR domain-containing protein [Candidatus Ozemobacteraceae bacterium]|nr:FecR domain-containing protein [Candidatus Ozemobacteraceae bacterium]
MKRLFLTLLLMVVVLVPAFAKDSGTRFSSLSGTVEVAADADAKADTWKFGKMDMVLEVDDHIKTGEESSAILSFADLSTFVMKEETHIILSTPPDKDSKVQLVAGKIWANVKKMAKDGSLEIEMSQAVAGIKGTNITCQSSPTEDRIQVLRGLAEVLVKETGEKISVPEGFEIVVKAGGKTDKQEVSVEDVQEEWKKQLENFGSSIQLNEVPDLIKEIMEEELAAFTELSNEFKALTSGEANDPDVVSEFKKDAERFIGVLLEDGMRLAAARAKIENELASPDLPSGDRDKFQGYIRQIAEAGTKMQDYQNQIGGWLKTNFLLGAATTGGTEVEQMTAAVTETWSSIESLMAEVSANPSGLSQDWFFEALDVCNEVMADLDSQAEELSAYLDEHPNDQAASNLLAQIGKYQDEIGNLLKDFNVVEIDGAVLTEMQDSDDLLSESIAELGEQIDAYNDAVSGQGDEVKLERSLGILNNFSQARRLYLSSQRLYDSIKRETSGQKFRTAEMEELDQTYERITETYNQLGIAATELESRLSELQSELGKQLQ